MSPLHLKYQWLESSNNCKLSSPSSRWVCSSPPTNKSYCSPLARTVRGHQRTSWVSLRRMIRLGWVGHCMYVWLVPDMGLFYLQCLRHIFGLVQVRICSVVPVSSEIPEIIFTHITFITCTLYSYISITLLIRHNRNPHFPQKFRPGAIIRYLTPSCK